MSRTILAALALVLAAALPAPRAAAGCSVVGMEGQTLDVAEPVAGDWQAAADAADLLIRKAKVAGDLFNRVYLGGYMRQEVQRSLDANDAEYAEAQAAAAAAFAPFAGTCGGEVLDNVAFKADGYRTPERAMVVNALKGKPIQASQKNIHEGRSLDLRDFERRWMILRDGADVGVGSAPGSGTGTGTDTDSDTDTGTDTGTDSGTGTGTE